MNYISSVFCLLSLAQLPVFNNGEPLFGNENVHIKVHVPGASIDCESANGITHSHHHQQHKHRKYPSHKPVRPQLRHNQFDDLLENILLSEFESPTINTHLDYTEHTDDINEHLTVHTEGYKSDYGKVVHKKPENFVKTYKIIEYKEPIISKNIYPTQQQHKPKTHNELYRIVESKYLPSTADGHELHNTNHYQYPIRTQTKSTKPHTNSKAVKQLPTANDYTGFKSAHKAEPSYNDDNSDPHVAFKPNTNIYLPPYETPVSSVDQTDTVAYNVLTPKDTLSLPKETEPLFSSADSSPLDDFQPNTNVYLPPYATPVISGAHTDTTAQKFLTPKETLTLPTKEAEDFHGQFKSPTFNDGHFKPFIGDKYLPVGGESSITQAAAETYTGIDSYSASHVQGLDHHSHSPYRRWSTLI